MPSKEGIKMGKGGSSGGRSLGSTARSIRAGVTRTASGRFRVPGLSRTFASREAATSVAENRQRQLRDAERARFR